MRLVTHPRWWMADPLALTLWPRDWTKKEASPCIRAGQQPAHHLWGPHKKEELMRSSFLMDFGTGQLRPSCELWESELLKCHISLSQSWHHYKPNNATCKKKTQGAGPTHQKVKVEKEWNQPTELLSSCSCMFSLNHPHFELIGVSACLCQER